MHTHIQTTVAIAALVLAYGASALLGARADETSLRPGDPTRGQRLLQETSYLGPAFDQETFDNVWRVWPEPLRASAEASTSDERRQMAYDRYGLDAREGDAQARPAQYAVDDQGRWSMTCLTCHAGSVAGRLVPGLPNAHLALQTLMDDIRVTKRLLEKPWTSADVAQSLFPLNKTVGTTNAVMFSVSLLSMRDVHLAFRPLRLPPRLRHHDMDAPAWWNLRKRTHLYIDGFAPKGARPLMQFTLMPQNGPETIRGWEQDFVDILAYLESLEPPAWPYEIDAELAAQGSRAFDRACASCHGTYGNRATYPNRRVPIGLVGTDRLRLDAITPDQRRTYAKSWFTHYDPAGVVIEPDGYVAPPLDGIWASAPYLHNGSVPTLWHMLHPDERPSLWRRTRNGYDAERVGLEIETSPSLPPEGDDAAARRRWFDTSRPGKSKTGHRFPDVLTAAEKRAVLEYLKTL